MPASKKFEYCRTCGIAENPSCNNCGKAFWHREMGAKLDGGGRTGIVNNLCPKCAKEKK